MEIHLMTITTICDINTGWRRITDSLVQKLEDPQNIDKHIMKRVLTILGIIMIVLTGYNLKSQTVINPSKGGYNDNDVGKFTKSFANKIMHHNPLFENFQGFSLDIDKWDVIEWPNGDESYRIFIKIAWNEVDGLTRKRFSYAGTLMCDKYGCNPMFLINEQEQPTLFTLGRRSIALNELNNYEQFISRMEKVCTGLKWAFKPDGCLENN